MDLRSPHHLLVRFRRAAARRFAVGEPKQVVGSATISIHEAATNILFIRTDRLGETLLNLPAAAALKTAFPESSVTFLANPSLTELLSTVPDLDAVIGEPRASGPWWWRAVRLACRLRAGRFHIALVSNPRKDLHLAVCLAGIPVRVGYTRKWAWALTRRVADRKALGERHEVEYNLDLVKALGVAVPAVPSYQLPVSPDAAQEVSQLLRGMSVGEAARIVAVHPWTSNPNKRWPSERFRDLIRHLRRLPGVVAAVIGGPEEPARACGAAENPGALDLVGRLSLTQLAAFLRRARVLVSNDSGPVHVAAAVGTPTVALFGTADPAAGPARWGPWGVGHTVIRKPTMDAISVEEVLQAVQRYV